MVTVKRSLPVLYILVACGITSCTAVAPWERGNLAKPQMALEPHPSQRALREHTYNSREASSGGSTSNGSGCGCY